METLEFSTNWNHKLDCDYFTTIRLQNPKKYAKGNEFQVLLHSCKKQVLKGVVEVVEIRNVFLNGLDDYTCMLDTGYNASETIKLIKSMYKNKFINWDRQLLSVIMLQKNRHKCKIYSHEKALDIHYW